MIKAKPWRRPMVARNHSEQYRQASWLELLFDLSFVVAVAQAAAQLEHAFADGHPGSGLIGYVVVFAAIWWAWVAFTWFANVFDTDDVPYRLLMIVMIAGSLGLAAGVPKIFALDFRVGAWRTSSCDWPTSVSGCAFFGRAREGGDRSPRRSSC